MQLWLEAKELINHNYKVVHPKSNVGYCYEFQLSDNNITLGHGDELVAFALVQRICEVFGKDLVKRLLVMHPGRRVIKEAA